MTSYETLFLARTEMTNDEQSLLENQLEKLAEEAAGRFVKLDKWGKYRLAYPVNKADYGIYLLARFELPKGANDEFDKELRLFLKIRCSEFIMRHVTVNLLTDISAEYIKPDSIESKAVENVDSFMKKNKMSGMLNTDVKASFSDRRRKEFEETSVVEQDNSQTEA